MDPMDFLHLVWKEQGEGFAFLSTKQDGEWQDLAYKYPEDEIEIPDASMGDVYFCPNLFREGKRREELVLPSVWLYADLDESDPNLLRNEFWPTVAWESSPRRYQCLWKVEPALKRKKHKELNKKLSYAVKADKGGWDITQVLRVPGTLNHKYTELPEVKLLWA